VNLDLPQDAAATAQLLRRRIDAYANRAARSPHVPPVSAVILGYAFDQRGWLIIHFDERPIHQPDGEWTRDIERYRVDLPHWHTAFTTALNSREPLTFVDANATTQQIRPGLTYQEAHKTFAWILGTMLRDVLLAAHREAAFTPLPKRPPCPLYVHEFEGYFDWPFTEPDEVYLAPAPAAG
jgi:hypothetical protein